ncbi:MAG: DUF167 domain-containing protein [Proteobacteria bacterium]|nr:DUF167 domain-containing protein [Pseudomonadota bacterium]
MPLTPTADGVLLVVKLSPKSGRDAIVGVAVEPGQAQPVLRVRVTAPPAEGQANAALIALLAKQWRLPKTSITIAGGAMQRVKRLHISGDPLALLRDIGGKIRTT